jgi:predicted DNA-binding transcriptional regulator YafY
MKSHVTPKSESFGERSMQRKTRGSEWDVFLRALALLHRLLQGPATDEELIAFARETIDEEIYPESITASKAALKHAKSHLRTRLRVKFTGDRINHKYTLIDPGPFGTLSLNQESLRGLALLARDFGNGLGERAYIRALMDEIIGRLDPATQRLLEHQPETLSLAVKQFVDKGEIRPKVWETVQRSIEKQRKLSFRHLSPRYEDQQPIYFEVAPVRVSYQDGHWYLRAWSLLRRTISGEELRGEPAYIRFRLNYMLDDEYLRLSPTVIPKPFRTPPRIPVHYLLIPEIGRGEISYHFAETEIKYHEDGSAEVHGFTEDVWEAARLLLSYGEGCVVLGGDDVLHEVRRRVQGMAKNYGYFVE